MGYEVHITRKANWCEEKGPSLSQEEWLNYVSQDHEMRADGFAEATTPKNETIRITNPSIVVWTAYSKHGAHGNTAWFSHFKDRITVKNPDPEILRKMYKIASSLNAHVQGDEGEAYGADGNPLRDTLDPSTSEPSIKKSLWRFWQ